MPQAHAWGIFRLVANSSPPPGIAGVEASESGATLLAAYPRFVLASLLRGPDQAENQIERQALWPVQASLLLRAYEHRLARCPLHPA